MMSVFVRGSVWIDAALRQDGRGDQRTQVFAARVAQRAGQRAQLARERLLFGQLAALRLLVGQHRQRRDADDGAVDDVAEPVRAQDDVERLIPRHVTQRHVHRALDGRIDHDVEAADLREGAEHRAQVGALEIEAHRVAGEALGRGAAGRRLRRRYRSGRRRRRLRSLGRRRRLLPTGRSGRRLRRRR